LPRARTSGRQSGMRLPVPVILNWPMAGWTHNPEIAEGQDLRPSKRNETPSTGDLELA
jgi:hypothetical protein